MSQLASPYQIGGGLNFQPGGNPMLGVAGGVAGLAQQYGLSYNSALQTNQQNYNNILSGYQQNMGNLQQGQTAVGQGYGNLMSGIQNTLGANYGVPGVDAQWGVAAPAARAIQKAYSFASGQQFDANGNPTGTPTGGSMGQANINAGLGNTTAATIDAPRSALSDYSTALGGLGAQLGQTYAGYQSNIGQAYLQQQNQENQSLANQGNQQLNWMNSVQAPYPSGAAYNQLYQQYGNQQATAQQFALQQQAQQQLLRNSGGRPSGGGVSTPQMPGMPGATYQSSGSGVQPQQSGNNFNTGPNGGMGNGLLNGGLGGQTMGYEPDQIVGNAVVGGTAAGIAGALASYGSGGDDSMDYGSYIGF